ncbi:hypothetical protein [Alkalinema sp. FACHB-956]|uniref:hypothetical protein n=1 Tax=Alkalinema sp. FACHB-956 TaxID=2692768 RepID=UPI001687C3E4|nr:hypothetical protein [Alkalinema sp. FACHB-956]MBD2327283.1 hypothetical protein [Alkalinema sp. FACHB-956]
MQSVKQMTQRKVTELLNWLHGDSSQLQQLLEQTQQLNPDKDTSWCIDKVWSEQRAWRV